MPMVTLPYKVPIAATGIEYPLSTGPRTFTENDLKDAIRAATEDPNIKDPRLQIILGHVGEDTTWALAPGAPSFGYFHDLELSDDGQEILASLTTLDWLADVLPVVYPSRSVDGRGDVLIKSSGKKYGLVIDRVALLGIEMPGITSIDDLRELVTNPEVSIVAKGKPAAKGADVVVRAQIDAEDVRRKFYSEVAKGERQWWWIRSIRLQPDEILATDEDSGQLYRIPYTITDSDITFGVPGRVYVSLVDEPKESQEPVAASQAILASWGSAAISRKKQEEGVDPKKLREQLGLAEDATDEQVNARISELREAAQASATGGDDTPPPDDDDDDSSSDDTADDDHGDNVDDQVPPDVKADPVAASGGTVTLDAEAYKVLLAGAKDGSEARKAQIAERRNGKIEAAIEKGKIPSSRRKHYRDLMTADEEGTTALLASLAEGIIPVGPEKGSDEGDDIAASQHTYDRSWLTREEQERVKQRDREMSEAN